MIQQCLLTCLCLLSICLSSSAWSSALRVACAANFHLPLEKISKNFAKDRSTETPQLVFGSSGQLAAQILLGAPIDVFLSADMQRPKKIYTRGMGASEVKPYALGRLILFTRSTLSSHIISEVLLNPGIRWIAMAKPDLAPYGRAALEFLSSGGLESKIESKLVYGENVMQAAQFSMNAADLGFLSRSTLSLDIFKPYDLRGKHWLKVDHKLHTPIIQGMILIERGSRNPEARTFFEYLQSEKSREVIAGFGYALPEISRSSGDL